MYGFSEPVVSKQSSVSFGLNEGFKLSKFEYTNQAGAAGAEGEAIDIEFAKGETTIKYRQFPVTMAFGKNGERITDVKAPEMVQAFEDFNKKMTHIMLTYVSKEELQEALTSVKSFKQYAGKLMLLLQNAEAFDKEVHLFMEYQAVAKDGRKFLQLPRASKNGAFIADAELYKGTWEEVKDKGLSYKNEKGEVHLFKRSEWYMNNSSTAKPAEKIAITIEDIEENPTEAQDW